MDVTTKKTTSRLSYSKKNVIVGIFSQCINVIITLITRTIFIKVLGLEYLGISNVFASILTILSVAELGIGEAISFSLYKPLAENDTKKISLIMKMFKKMYSIVAISIVIFGIVLVPFLKYIIKESIEVENIYIVYFLYVINSVVTYFCAYKKILLIADQRKYIESLVNAIMLLLMYVVQIIVLIIFRNYLLYFSIQVLFNLLINIVLTHIVNKRYPYINNSVSDTLSKEDKKMIFKNFVALAIQRVNGVIAQSIDNIILSLMLGTVIVGKYSNYLTIEKYLTQFIIVIFTALTGSIGNLIATESKERHYEVFKKINFFAFWIFAITTICYFSSVQTFIKFWLGSEDYLIDISIVFVIALNYYVMGVRHSVTIFKNAYGLYWQDRYKPIISAVVNIVFSLLLTYKFGMIGVGLGTLISYLLVNSVIEPFILFKYGFNRDVKGYYIDYIIKICVVSAICIVSVLLFNFLSIDNYLLKFIVIIMVDILVYNFFFIIIFRKNESYKYFVRLLKNMVKKSIK